jgi:Fe-S-cluster formation regulator IscX/YfhJ
LYILSKVAGMDAQQVVRLLTIANDDLPSVEYRYEKLKREEASLQAGNQNSAMILQELSDQISGLRNTSDSYRLSCEQEKRQMTELHQKKMKLEGLVNDFQDSNEEYLKVIKAVGEEVLSVLSNAKVFLRYALLSIAESMRNNPERYRSIIYNMSPSIIDYGGSTGQDYTASYMYGQIQPEQYPSPDHVTEAIVAVILEEAEKLFNKPVKDSINKVITDRTFSKSLSSLPLLQPSDEQQQRRTRSSPTAAVNQTRTCREENTFIQSEEIANEELENKSC